MFGCGFAALVLILVMLQKIFTKYWLVVNIGFMILLTWIVLPGSVEAVTFVPLLWMSLILCEFFVLLPSVYRNENFSGARLRGLKSLSWDPFLYVGLFIILYLFTQWSNGGCSPEYDVNANVWGYTKPEISWLPFSIDKADSFRWLNLFVAIITAGLCIRNAIGKRAKRYLLQWLCGLSGLYAAYAVTSGCLDVAPYNLLMLEPETSSMGTFYGFWLIIAIGAYAEAHSARQKRIELVYLLGIVANFIGLLFFAPLHGVVIYSVISLLLFVYVGIYLSAHVPSHFLVKFFLITIITFAAIIIVPLFLFPKGVVMAKFGLVSDLPGYWGELAATLSVRRDAAMQIWGNHMWFGSGPNGFGHYLGSVMDDASWKNVVINKGFVYNDPVQILCEFGVLGSAMLVALFVTLLVPLCHRAHIAWAKDVNDTNAGRPYLVRISPLVFTGVIATLCCFTESFIASPFRMPAMLISFFIVVFCMPAFLPSR